MRFLSIWLLVIVALAQTPAMSADAARKAHLYKNPQCGCCESYADYLRQNGFDVTVEATHDLTLIKQEYGVPENLEGCHTTLIDGYVVEGHVPVASINRMLTEHPKITGISLPGMPAGSPGMMGDQTEPLTVYEIGDGPERIYGTK